MSEKSRENQLRRWAARMDWKIMKSRARVASIENLGGYKLLNDRGECVAGDLFDADLCDVSDALEAEQERLWGWRSDQRRAAEAASDRYPSPWLIRQRKSGA